MSDEPEYIPAPGEESEEAEAHGEAVAGSYLRRCVCTVCRVATTLAVPERAAVAMCGTCRWASVGGGEGGSARAAEVKLGPVVGYPRGEYVPAVVERVLHPAPQVSSRDEVVARCSTPAPVLDLGAGAVLAGWEVRTQYARGNGLHSRLGTPLGVVDSWAVRLQLGSKHAVVVYEKGTSGGWKSVWIFGPELPWFGGAGITELKEYVEQRGEVCAGWFADIVQRRADADERAKIRKACDAGKHGEVGQDRLTGEMHCLLCLNRWDPKKTPWKKSGKAREHA